MESCWYSIKTWWEIWLPLKLQDREVISHSNNNRLWSFLLCIWKHRKLCNNCVLFLLSLYPLATLMTKWAQIFAGLLFYADMGYVTKWEYWSLTINYQRCPAPLKKLDTIGNCQRPGFSLGVSHHMHKITNLWKFELKRSSKLRDNNERKNILVTWSCVFRCLISRPRNSKSEVLKFVENYFCLKTYSTSEGAASHNVLYYQPLPITCYQVRFCANN